MEYFYWQYIVYIKYRDKLLKKDLVEKKHIKHISTIVYVYLFECQVFRGGTGKYFS